MRRSSSRYGRRNVRRGPGGRAAARRRAPRPAPACPSAVRRAPRAAPEGRHAGHRHAAGGAAPQEDSSTTNVQEQGVDEPDVVKSRGSTIFAVAGEQLHAIDTSGGGARGCSASLPLEGYGHELLLFEGSRARVLAHLRPARAGPGAESGRSGQLPLLRAGVDAPDRDRHQRSGRDAGGAHGAAAGQLRERPPDRPHRARRDLRALARALYDPGMRDAGGRAGCRGGCSTDAATGQASSRRLDSLPRRAHGRRSSPASTC